MAISDHEFGGDSTDLKLSLVEGYLTAFTTALRKKFPQRRGTLMRLQEQESAQSESQHRKKICLKAEVRSA